MATTTLKQQMADLNRLRQNTESFLYGFLNFTTSQKPPFPNSWLGFDLDRNTYVFMCLNEHSEYVNGHRMIYYPDGTNRILMTPETKWLYRIYNDVNFNREVTDRQAYLRRVAATVQPILKRMLDEELAALKAMDVPVEKDTKPAKTLF